MTGAQDWTAGASRFPFAPFRRLYRPISRPVRGDEEIVTAYTDGQVTRRSNRDKVGYHQARDLAGYVGVRTGDLVVHGLDILRGSVGVADSDGAMSSVCTVCPPTPHADARFVAYSIRAQAMSGLTRAMARGVREGGADFRRWDTLAELPVPVPPLEEQRRIADFLDDQVNRIDNIIAGRQQQEALIRERARSLVGLSVVGALGRTLEVTEDWLAGLNASWELIGPGVIFRERRESARPDDEHLTPSQVYGVVPQTEYMKLTGSRVVLNLAGQDKMKHVEPDDFVIHLRSFQGGIEHSRVRGKVSNAYTVLRLVRPAEVRYLRWVLKSPGLIQALQATTDQLRDGQSIKFGQLKAIRLPFPPVDEQRRIADYLDSEVRHHDELRQALAVQISKLQERKKSLITAAVTGQLDRSTVAGVA